MTHATVASAKTALRLAVRNRRKGLVAEHPEADWIAAEIGRTALAARFPRPAGKTAALYQAIGSEIDPAPLGELLAEDGWTLALPRAGERGWMSFHRWAPGDKLDRDAANLAAPFEDAPLVHPDLVIAPLLAFDRHGGRLGQGAGWYDRALALLRKRKPTWVVGLAYSGQEVARVPAEDHDQRLDAILTETGYRTAEPPEPQTAQD
jgi:5-formyltetrahydrofolate cyclo-ligase